MEARHFPSCMSVKRRERRPRPACLSPKTETRSRYEHLLLPLASAPWLSCALEQLLGKEEAGGTAVLHESVPDMQMFDVVALSTSTIALCPERSEKLM